MEDEWIEQLRKKLENYEVEPPPELWERICDKMGMDPVTMEKKPVVSRWWWAVAAAVLALVGCFVVYEMSDSEQSLQAEAVVQQQPSLSPSSEPVVVQHPSSQQQDEIASPRSKSHVSHVPSHGSQSVSLISDLSSLTSEEPQEPQAATEEMVYHQETPAEPGPQPSSAKPSEYEAFSGPVPPVVYETSASQTKWSVALKASGGLLAANSSMQSDRLYMDKSHLGGFYDLEGVEEQNYSGIYDGYKEFSNSTSYTVTQYAAKHHLPLRLGLSLHYQFHPRLALLSGISYTRLSSEFSFPLYRNISYSQRLHYIGIPLGVAWQLWKANRLSFYCSGGTMVEKCVSVSLDGNYSGKKPWQFSVSAAAGAEYAFIPSLGVYIEPSLGYYFSDGTQLEHYYKEHPLAPSIEFGLRLHVGK